MVLYNVVNAVRGTTVSTNYSTVDYLAVAFHTVDDYRTVDDVVDIEPISPFAWFQ